MPVWKAEREGARSDHGRCRLSLYRLSERSGSPFGEAAYYSHEQIEISGEARQFTRPTDAGGHFDQFFCPDCGTTVYMRGTKNPDVTGIPIGLFDEPHAMRPVRSVWKDRRHDWVEIAPALQHFPRARVG